MKKLIVSLFFLFNTSEYCFGLDKYDQNLNGLKKKINEVFGIEEEENRKPVYLISVTRTSKNKNGNEVQNPTIKDISEVKEILSKVSEKINQNCYDGHKIIAFNEMFFSQEKPLNFSDNNPNVVTHNNVMQCVQKFNANIQNSIVFCNLLYKENKNISLKDALYLYALTLFQEGNGRFNTGSEVLKNKIAEHLWTTIDKKFFASVKKEHQSIVKKYVEMYKTQQKDKNTFSKLDFEQKNTEIDKTIKFSDLKAELGFLINKTYCIYRGNSVFSYKKSTYYKEHNNSLERDYIYDLGDGYPIISNKYSSDDAVKRIFNTISTEICMDFACGIRKNNNWKSTRGNSLSSKLHIIQSNSVEAWLSKKENYPFNVPILYSDARSCFPNFRMGFGGVTCCLDLSKDKEHIIKSSNEQATLFNKVVNIIPLQPKKSSNNNITDHYNIWICKI